ncbi:hypothetical protein EDM57_04215 [Brevibacillus gelatini]|uniref:Uncharacterized protein n=1 Tax=Brevibacillus gelatini TaxID=1655277 RepID=A0A3M8B7Q7_9BACL|nr:hypothetical protein [Brevibacillus gelatini]RNB59353.1 hypothetical protein EDM57_04215 [Brevibacillus gelatini]
MKENQTKLKLIAIKTKEKVFISDNIENSYYHTSRIKQYLFDGVEPKETYQKSWYELKSIPNKVERRVPPQRINERYELKAGFPESELTPKIINEKYIDEDSPYAEVIGLYEKKFELTEETYEEIPFEINIIEELDQFEITKQEYELKYNFLDLLNTHPVLLPTKPCKMTRKDSFNIIRKYIRENIDQRYAKIDADYDFVFRVKKKIELYEPFEYEVNLNQGTRRKPNFVKRYRNTKEITILEISPDVKKDYEPATEFSGENEQDLKNKINTYLQELIAEINRPYVECKHCQGYGVVLKEDN